MRRVGLLLTALLSVTAVIAACGGNPFLDRVREMSGPREGVVATPLPNPTFLTVAGDSTPLVAHLGERLTLLNLGGTWCAPCEREMPSLQQFHQQWSDQGVLVLSVMTNSPPDEIEDWITRYSLTFPILQGLPSSDWIDVFGEIADGVPRNLVVDEEGVVRFFFRGYRTGDEIDALMHPWLVAAGVEMGGRPAPSAIATASVR